MRVVIALGGNALLRRGEAPSADAQRANVAVAADAVAELAAEHDIIVTHGNGPQIGLLALQAAADPNAPPVSLDVLGAESDGMIGYLIDQELTNRLPGWRVATLLTQVVVAADDPAFEHPSKPVGPVYSATEGTRLAGERGWIMVADGDGVRRAVPSPEPRRIIEIETIRLLADAGVIVICNGGGGIPVVETATGGLAGVEAVIDKDRSSALLASEIGADALLLLTDVPAVQTDWCTPQARALKTVSPDALATYEFQAGTMGPKVEAARRFVAGGGQFAAIGTLGDAAALLAGTAGTRITASAEKPTWY